MKLKQYIKYLQKIEKKYGGDIKVCRDVYGDNYEYSLVNEPRYVGNFLERDFVPESELGNFSDKPLKINSICLNY